MKVRVGIVLGGIGAAVLLGVSQGLPADDLVQLIGIAFAVAAIVAAGSTVLLGRSHRTSLRTQAVIVALASVAATGVGTVAAARAMFVSTHDLTALFVVLVAAASVGVLGAVELGSRVGRASRNLGELTRRIVMDGVGEGGRARPVGLAPFEPAPSTAELDRLADELQDMSRRLAEAHEREQALESARRELVAWVSHDLRTPLAGIRAMAEALQDGVVDDPDTVARYHATIQSETDRLARLVDDLFELSRIQAHRLSLTLERASLGDVVSDALASSQALADAKGVVLEGRAAGGGVPVELSTPEMGRVLRNLLDNAIRHTPAGGRIVVELGRDDRCAHVVVADQCGGIPTGDLDRVFDPAYRGDSARTPEAARGGGLGLAIARGLVEAHGGTVIVSNVDHGCRFTVQLPLAGAAPLLR
jgi:signal transduction histidine kinase